ncbi:MAG: citrate transporter [Burkholderiaceae bacterium]|nr:MAG: citrate transporter [Burkholderiaceae bacterium]
MAVPDAPTGFGIPVEFFLFTLTLLGVALFHQRAMEIALTSAVVTALYKILFSAFSGGIGVAGFLHHLGHEWVILVNLFALLMGFELLSRHFSESHVPAALPRFLPGDWKGGFVLLVLVFVMSAFLDNIAAAIIGGTIAATVFQRRVHIGYLAAIVAASNAGGAGSVIGDTTTTMMWISGIPPLQVVEAALGALVALMIFGIPASIKQHTYSPILKDEAPGNRIDWARVGVVALILGAAIAVNLLLNMHYRVYADAFPFIGAAVWAALLIAAPLRRPDWTALPEAFRGSVFLVALVLCASMMPVEHLPHASWTTALVLGFVSAVFDNIPLTALALKQGGYDWGFLAYAVGFGGSMIWFGSSAGVALSNLYPEARSVWQWLCHGWPVVVAYVAGFVVMLTVIGWHPREPVEKMPAIAVSVQK